MKRILHRIFITVIFALLLLACERAWNYLLIDDTASYTRIMMHQLYEPENNIEIIFVGSSHVYRSLIPSITDEEFGKYTFNAGSSSQQMDGSLTIIKEALAYNKIKHVFLEVYYGVADGDDFKERKNMTATYLISDYMKPSLRRVDYLLQASDKDHWINSFIPARRNWEKLLDPSYIKNLIFKKQTEDYKNYVFQINEDQPEYYVDRGFVANDSVVNKDICWNESSYGKINVTSLRGSDWEKSLIKAINFCTKNKIKITLFAAPQPEWTTAGKQNYQEYHDYVKNLAENNNVEFYDFNLCKDIYFNTDNMEFFMDESHLNTKGAEIYSHLFGEIFSGKMDPKNVFYNSFYEKISSKPEKVYGVTGASSNTDSETRNCYIISNRKKGIEYKITAYPSDGGQRCIQDFNENIKFILPTNEKGTLMIEWRNSLTPDIIYLFETKY